MWSYIVFYTVVPATLTSSLWQFSNYLRASLRNNFAFTATDPLPPPRLAATGNTAGYNEAGPRPEWLARSAVGGGGKGDGKDSGDGAPNLHVRQQFNQIEIK